MKRPIVITLLVLVMLCVLAGIGAVVFFSVRGGDITFDQSLVSATAEESKTLKVDAEKPVTLTVEDGSGNVSVTGGDVKAVQVKIIKTGNAPTQARAEEDLKNIKYEIQQNGNVIKLIYKIDSRQTNHMDNVDFIVTVPNQTDVDIDSNMGEVSVQDIQGVVEIKNDFGDVTADNIEGALSVDNNSGELSATSISAGAEDIKLISDFGGITLAKAEAANITVDSNSGSVTLKDVKAKTDLLLKSDFGDTKYENGSAGSLTIETNSGKVELIKLKVGKLVKVENEFGDIELSQVAAETYDLQTNSGVITVDGAKGGLKANTDFGNIDIKNAQSVTLDLKTNSGNVDFSGSLGKGPHTVVSEFGNIILALSADSKLNVSLKTDFGNIESDLPVTVTLNETSSADGDEIVGTINGGGEELSAETNSGNISINAVK